MNNELTGRSLLPSLQDMFIAPCFRQATNPSNIQDCLVDSILYYGSLLMGVAAIVCFAYIVKAGYIMFTAFGDEAKYTQGKKTLLYAIIGLAIAVASGFLIDFFVRLLGYTGIWIPNPFV